MKDLPPIATNIGLSEEFEEMRVIKEIENCNDVEWLKAAFIKTIKYNNILRANVANLVKGYF